MCCGKRDISRRIVPCIICIIDTHYLKCNALCKNILPQWIFTFEKNCLHFATDNYYLSSTLDIYPIQKSSTVAQHFYIVDILCFIRHSIECPRTIFFTKAYIQTFPNGYRHIFYLRHLSPYQIIISLIKTDSPFGGHSFIRHRSTSWPDCYRVESTS